MKKKNSMIREFVKLEARVKVWDNNNTVRVLHWKFTILIKFLQNKLIILKPYHFQNPRIKLKNKLIVAFDSTKKSESLNVGGG